MSSAAAKDVAPFPILVSQDRLQAWVGRPTVTGGEGGSLQVADILRALEAAGIAMDDAVRARAEQWAALLAPPGSPPSGDAPPEIPEKFLIASGTAPTQAEDGSFEWDPAYAPVVPAARDDGPIDYHAQSSIRTVPAGVVIGRIKPPTDGVAGQDVYGRPLQPARRRGTPLNAGPGLQVGPDSGEVRTTVAGRVVVGRGTLRIEESLELRGDVDFESGNIDACVDVVVRGTVRAGFHVRTTGSLTVGKAIEAAGLDIGGDLTVRGGLSARNGAHPVRAGGCISVRYCDEGWVSAVGDILIEKETLNSRVRTLSRLVSPRGTIIGGDVWAREGVEAAVLGSAAGVTTRVRAGVSPQAVWRARQLEKEARDLAKSAGQIREKVQPLLANLRRLTPEQHNLANEWVAKAEALEARVHAVRAERERVLADAQPSGLPQIVVHRMIHPGVRLALGARETVIAEMVPGPIKIEERKLEGVTEIVCVNERTGSVRVLPGSEIEPGTLPPDEAGPPGGAAGDPRRPANSAGT